MKSTLALLPTANLELVTIRTMRSDTQPTIVPAEGEAGCRCDLWGHPCPNCADVAILARFSQNQKTKS